jgi:hypothetical protein
MGNYKQHDVIRLCMRLRGDFIEEKDSVSLQIAFLVVQAKKYEKAYKKREKGK